MVNLRRVCIASVASLAVGFTLAPLSAGADAPVTAPAGTATTASVSLEVAPAAILNVPSTLLSALSSLPGGSTLTSALQKVTIDLDAASASGTLNSAMTDLTAAHAVSQVAQVNVTSLRALIAALQSVLDQVTGAASTVTALLPSTYGQQLNALTTQLTAPISTLLGSLSGLNLNRAGAADLAQGPVADRGNAIDLAPAGLNLQLGPLTAIATDQAHLAAAGVTSPQAAAQNSTEALSLGPVLNLSGLVNNTLLTTLIAQVNAEITGALQTVAAAPQSSTVTTIISSLPAPLQGPVSTAVSTAVGTATATTATVVTAINTDVATLQALLAGLLNLQNVLGPLLGQVDLNQIVSTSGITSSSLVEPRNGAVHALASNTFADMKILTALSGALGGAGVAAGTPLIEINGVNSVAEATVNGSDTSAPTGSSGFGSISVLGKPVIGSNPPLTPGTSQTVPVPVGPYTLTLVVTAGVPQVINNTPGHKTVHVSALEVNLFNGAPDGTGGIPALGAAAARANTAAAAGTSSSNLIVSAQLSSSSVDVASQPGQVQAISSVLPSTGAFGPRALLVAAVLAMLGLSARVVPTVAARARRRL